MSVLLPALRVCKRGHVQIGDNVQEDADGRRRCRPCARLRRRRRYDACKTPCPSCGAPMAAASATCQACRPQPLEERFLRYVEKTETCWLWTGHRDAKGYGRFLRSKGSSERAHRMAYELWVGEIPAGLDLHHRCERRECVRPDHLEPRTPSDHARFHRSLR